MLAIRKAQGKTQKYVADAIGLSRDGYAKYERGESSMPLHYYNRFNELFHNGCSDAMFESMMLPETTTPKPMTPYRSNKLHQRYSLLPIRLSHLKHQSRLSQPPPPWFQRLKDFRAKNIQERVAFEEQVHSTFGRLMGIVQNSTSLLAYTFIIIKWVLYDLNFLEIPFDTPLLISILILFVLMPFQIYHLILFGIWKRLFNNNNGPLLRP